MSAPVKDGYCKQCGQNHVQVRWHDGTKRYLCNSCWPAIKEAKFETERLRRLPTHAEQMAHRDKTYGLRIEDDPDADGLDGNFRVRCGPCGRTIASSLWILDARRVKDNHELEHLSP
jgi:ssDNA-binding Zn-finger/Zn-ribbon topoisomerase 1